MLFRWHVIGQRVPARFSGVQANGKRRPSSSALLPHSGKNSENSSFVFRCRPHAPYRYSVYQQRVRSESPPLERKSNSRQLALPAPDSYESSTEISHSETTSPLQVCKSLLISTTECRSKVYMAHRRRQSKTGQLTVGGAPAEIVVVVM